MVAPTKVLVVDDSLTMRVLLSSALERIPDVVVVGAADGADEARTMTAEFHPDVITLDVEMPGMSGLEYLAEVMAHRPMPVIMFSSRTEAGAEASVEALRLGAIACFPKPKVAVAAEFDKMLGKIGKQIKSAKSMTASLATSAKAAATDPAMEWNGRLLAIGAETSNTQAIFKLFSSFPENCPPTVMVQHFEPGLADAMVGTLAKRIAPKIVLAEDGMAIEQGTIYLAPPGDAHLVVDGWPSGKLRMLARGTVAGERPSISVLFASIAKTAGAEAVGVLLGTDGEDGVVGIKAMRLADAHVVAPSDAPEPELILVHKTTAQGVPADQLAHRLLALCSR